MSAREYSQRLGPLTDEQFKAALARLGLGEFVRAEPVTGGLFGQNVFLTSTRGKYVLRGAPHYDWQLPAERFFAKLLHERTKAPVAWPYLIDPAEDIFGWSYAIMPRMPGIQLTKETTANLTPVDRLQMAQAMADNLALVHQLAWGQPGSYRLEADTVVAYEASWPNWVAHEVHSWLVLARKHSNRTTTADVAWVTDLLARARLALEEAFVPTCVLRDYREANTVMSRVADEWVVSGMFDLMEASIGDGEMDLSRQMADYLDEEPELARAFLSKYLEQRPARIGFGERFPIYMLRDRAIIWEYLQRPGGANPFDRSLTFRQWAEPYTAALDMLRP